MSSTSLKHQARLQEWAAAVQDCRGSGLPVSRWCRENGITATTYYRWKREVLAIAETSRKLSEHALVEFAELPAKAPVSRNVSKPSATLRIGNGSMDLYQELTPELLQTLVNDRDGRGMWKFSIPAFTHEPLHAMRGTVVNRVSVNSNRISFMIK